jgi:hypothetical protein
MFYKELRLLFIDIKKWEALSKKLNVSDTQQQQQQMAQVKLALREAILIEQKKLSELELNIANQSIKIHNVVEGTLASTNQNMDTQAILALSENNNQQEVELIIDFNPSWVFIFEQNKKGLSTIKQFETTAKTLPFDCTLDAATYNLELGKGYKAVAYLKHPKEDSAAPKTVVSFTYDGSQEILVQVMNKKSQELEDQLDENDAHYKQITKKREKIQLLLNEKHNMVQGIINNNTNLLIEEFCDFCDKTLTYPSIPGSLDTERKFIGSVSSSFTQNLLVESGKKLVGTAKKIGFVAVTTQTGASVGGVYGAIIGFSAGIVLDILVNKGVEAYVLDSTEDLTYKARRQKIDAVVSKERGKWKAEAVQKTDQLLSSTNSSTSTIFNNESLEELNLIHKELKQYKKEEKPLIKGDYYKELLTNWVFTNANDSDDSNIQDNDIWQESLEKLFELGVLKESDCDTGPAIRYQPDVYLYQLKGVLAIMGMSCGLIEILTNNHNLLTKDIRDRLTNPNSSPSLENAIADDCQAYDTYYDEISQKMSFTISSNEIKVQDKKRFVDFFKFSLDSSNENFSGIVSKMLNEFIQDGANFTLDLEINLKKDASSVFFSNLRWFIFKPNVKDSIKGIFSYD